MRSDITMDDILGQKDGWHPETDVRRQLVKICEEWLGMSELKDSGNVIGIFDISYVHNIYK